MNINIRFAAAADARNILNMIKELAEYEKAPNEVSNTVEMMLQDGFSDNPIFKCFVAEENETMVGIALFYFAYSTWKGKYLYLDDLIVTEKYRQHGVGKMLFDKVIQFAASNNCNQMRWHVLNWNTPAINFYKKYNASLDPEWITGKLTREQINSAVVL